MKLPYGRTLVYLFVIFTSFAFLFLGPSVALGARKPSRNVTVTITPSSVALAGGGTQQFTAAVSGTWNKSVTWSGTGGVITTSGLYTAPLSAGTYMLTATSVADPTKSATTLVTVATQPAPAVSISVSPGSVSLSPGSTQQFTATVTGSTNTGVTWSGTGGSITTSGLYTAPSTPGTYVLTATSVADTSKSATAAITVAATAAQIAVSPTSVSFGSVTTNTTATQSVIIANSGGSSLSVNGATVNGGSFSTAGAAFPFTIAAGQSASLPIQFAPTAAGTFTGTLTVLSNASNATPVVSLSGAATAPSTLALSASPGSVSFGSVLVGSTSTQSITLTNTGNSSVSVSAENLTGGVFTSVMTLPLSLAPGASTTVRVNFTPDTSGPFTGSVSFVSNATNSPSTVALSGSGTAPVQHSVDLSWVGSTSTSVVGYYVYRSGVSGGPYSKISTAIEPTTYFTDATVKSGTTYFYVVTAVDGTGMESGYSNQSSAAVPTP